MDLNNVNGRVKLAIIICDRYRTCAAGKCMRAMHNREGAFQIYKNNNIQLVGYTTCAGCPGGNVEYAPAEMKKNEAQVIHFATGLIVGYPPCPYLFYFRKFIKDKYDMDVVMGTHPIPQTYWETHNRLRTWKKAEWRQVLEHIICDKETRINYC